MSNLLARLETVNDQGGDLFESVTISLSKAEIEEALSALGWWASRKQTQDSYRSLLRSSEKYIEKAEAEADALRAEIAAAKAECGAARAAVRELASNFNALSKRLALAEAVCEELKGSTPADIVGNEGARLLEVWRAEKLK